MGNLNCTASPRRSLSASHSVSTWSRPEITQFWCIFGWRIRGRLSKIQNQCHCLPLHSGACSHEIFTELQPLRKDGPTIGQALINTVLNLLQYVKMARMTLWEELHFFHVLTGDGENTNMAAARHLLGSNLRLSEMCTEKNLNLGMQQISGRDDGFPWWFFVAFAVPSCCSEHCKSELKSN